MPITKINKDVVAIKTYAMDNNTYILIKDKKAIIIDPSFAGDELLSYFNENKDIEPKAIILTHAHFDHCIDTAKFLKKYDVPVYIHKLDQITYEKYNCADWVDLELPKFDKNIKYFDAKELNIDAFNLTILLTPGHTSGCISIIYKDYVFVGDTLFYNSYGRTDLKNSSESDIIISIKTLYKVLKDDMYVFTGHGKWATFKEVKEANYMANALAK